MRPSRFQSVSPWRMKYIGGFGSITVLHNRNVGRFGILHADDVIARIDMHDLTGDAATQFRQKIDTRIADLVDGDGAPQGGVLFVPFEDVEEVPETEGGQRLER